MTRSMALSLSSWARSVPAALLLSLLLVAPTSAASWTPPVTLASGVGLSGGLVTTGLSTAVAIYSSGSTGVSVRRSTDGALTWGSPRTLSETGSRPAIAGRGRFVDVAWLDGRFVRYARSVDGGATFGPSVALSPEFQPTCEDCGLHFVSVARGPGGLVAVAWSEQWGDIQSFVRVSTDGGSSFGRRKDLGFVIWPRVAAGTGVVYVIYSDENDVREDTFFPLLVRRSVNGGVNWSAAKLLEKENGFARWMSIAASGKTVYVATTGTDQEISGAWIRIRKSTDAGKTWSPSKNITSAMGNQGNPVLSLRGGVLRMLYSNPLLVESADQRVFYRKSRDGSTWTTPERVGGASANPLGVGYACRAIAMFVTPSAVRVRTRLP